MIDSLYSALKRRRCGRAITSESGRACRASDGEAPAALPASLLRSEAANAAEEVLVLLVLIKVRFLSPPYSNCPGSPCLTHLGTEGEGLMEMGRKAVFLRLRESRTSDVNTEIQTDRDKVGSFLQRLSFSKVLIASLEQAEKSYREATNAFEYKECMSHLRSFLEDLHKEACILVQRKRGGAFPANWGKAIAYLAQEAVLTKTEEEFITALYRLVSDVGVHPLVAEREYARLMRNMNIEYGLLFLTRLDKWMATP
jgi:hypothetical protein